MILPPLCTYHLGIFAAKALALTRRGHVRHPGARRALNAEATHHSDQCCRKALGLAPRWRP